MADLEKNSITTVTPPQPAAALTQPKNTLPEEVKDILTISDGGENCDVKTYRMVNSGGMSYNDLVQTNATARACQRAGVGLVVIKEAVEESKGCVFEEVDLKAKIRNISENQENVVFEGNRLVAWENTGETYLSTEPQLLPGNSADEESGLIPLTEVSKKEDPEKVRWTGVEILAIDWDKFGVKQLSQESVSTPVVPQPAASLPEQSPVPDNVVNFSEWIKKAPPPVIIKPMDTEEAA